jgi:hypothetical protein
LVFFNKVWINIFGYGMQKSFVPFWWKNLLNKVCPFKLFKFELRNLKRLQDFLTPKMRMHLRVLGVFPCTFTHFPFICGCSHNIKSHILYLHLLNLYLKYLWKIIMNAQLQFGFSIFFSKVGSMTCKVSMLKIWYIYMMFQVYFHMIKNSE